jgi:hypothetical protein
MNPLTYLKLICESIIAIPKIMGEVRDAYLFTVELKDENWYEGRVKERATIDVQIQAEIRKKNAKALIELHRSRYNL